MLGIGGKGVHMLIDIARGRFQIILAPIGSENGGGVLRESEDSFHLSIHHHLFLRLHIVADGIILRLHVILLTITETVYDEVCLQ